MTTKKIGCIASQSPHSKRLMQRLIKRYGFFDVKRSGNRSNVAELDVLVVLGGDGFMLHILHLFREKGIKIYGINCGTLGFLLNRYHEDADLLQHIENAITTEFFPIRATICTKNNKIYDVLAFNEVYVMRQTCQAANIRLSINGEARIDCMICDGVLLATPPGSSAYNLSAGGSVLPINAELLSLTAICPFRPRRWRGAIIPSDSLVEFEVLSPEKRDVYAVADFREYRHVVRVKLQQDQTIQVPVLFDSACSLHERMIQEQFFI